MAIGQDIISLATLHIGEKYEFGVVVPKKNSNWHGPWDCAEFASWCVYQVSGILYGCSKSGDAYTGYWADDAERYGKMVSVREAASVAGAFLLRYPSRRESPRIGHIAISDGLGGTIEAYNRKYGVIKNKVDGRLWDTGVLVPGIDYNHVTELLDYASPEYYRVKAPYMKGDNVIDIHNKLKKYGIEVGKEPSVYDTDLEKAVFAFQLSEGLVPDGEVGNETMSSLRIKM